MWKRPGGKSHNQLIQLTTGQSYDFNSSLHVDFLFDCLFHVCCLCLMLSLTEMIRLWSTWDLICENRHKPWVCAVTVTVISSCARCHSRPFCAQSGREPESSGRERGESGGDGGRRLMWEVSPVTLLSCSLRPLIKRVIKGPLPNQS